MNDTKTLLLDSAERAARSRGYDGFSFADMAAEVGIKKASIHYHFPTKIELATCLMQRYNQALSEALNGLTGSAATRLNGFIDYYRQGMNEATSVCLCVAFSISSDRLEQDVLVEIRNYRHLGQSWLTQVFRDARKDKTISGLTKARPDAAATLALLEGAQIGARAEGSMDRFELAIRPLLLRLQG